MYEESHQLQGKWGVPELTDRFASTSFVTKEVTDHVYWPRPRGWRCWVLELHVYDVAGELCEGGCSEVDSGLSVRNRQRERWLDVCR